MRRRFVIERCVAVDADQHAHVFFEPGQLAEAEVLRALLIDALPPAVTVGACLPHAAGPLPQPMFEIDCPAAHVDVLRTVLATLCAGRSVLIHPVMADELSAHTRYAEWLGRPLALRIDSL
jgi:DOPA 4,5-dioxygenase